MESIVKMGTNDRRRERICRAYETLVDVLRSLKGLPLAITGTRCLSAYYRGTKAFPVFGSLSFPQTPQALNQAENKNDSISLAKSKKSPPLVPSIKVVLIIERVDKGQIKIDGSIEPLKMAFQQGLAALLLKARSRQWTIHPIKSRLLVSLMGVVFSINPVFQDEIDSMDQRQLKSIPQSGLPTRRLILKSKISHQLLSLTKKSSVFADSCQLVRRWLAFNFLSKTLEGLAVELLVAHAFTSPDLSTPLTAVAGLAAFLHFLSTHDFLFHPVVVDINRSFNADKLAVLRSEFIRRRPTLPLLTICIPEDPSGTMFTRSKPEPVAFKRLIQIASSCYAILSQLRISSISSLPEDFFRHDFSGYDLLIRLRGKHLVVGGSHSDSNGRLQKKRRWTAEEAESLTIKAVPSTCSRLGVIDYNPSKLFVKELKEHFGGVAMFFYNEYESHVIGVALRPSFTASRENMQMDGCELRRKNSGTGEQEANMAALVEDIKISGHGLVRDVIVTDRTRTD